MSETLARHIKVLSGWAFPSEGFNELEGLPLIRIRDLGSGTTEVKFKGSYDPRYVIDDGDVLIGMDGDFSVKKWTGGAALLNQRVCKIESASEHLDQDFLFWYLVPHVAEVHRKTPQTTVRHLSASSLGDILAPPISVAEQRSVSQVLDTLDTTIRQTEAIIEKLKQVKQGLLHDLLTRGIDANGELRPPQSQAPHLYKDSPLGWIPREWEAAQLGAFAYITKLAGYEYTNYFDYSVGGEVICVRVLNLKQGALDLTDTQTIPRSVSQRLPRSQLHRDDLVLSYVGTIGEVARIPDDDRFHLAPNVAKITVRQDSAHAEFLAAYIASAQGRKRLLNLATITSQPSISMERVRQLQAPLPPLGEQAAIARTLSVCDGRTGAEQAQLACLAQLRSGLMDDLLTGRVRITPLLEASR